MLGNLTMKNLKIFENWKEKNEPNYYRSFFSGR